MSSKVEVSESVMSEENEGWNQVDPVPAGSGVDEVPEAPLSMGDILNGQRFDDKDKDIAKLLEEVVAKIETLETKVDEILAIRSLLDRSKGASPEVPSSTRSEPDVSGKDVVDEQELIRKPIEYKDEVLASFIREG